MPMKKNSFSFLGVLLLAFMCSFSAYAQPKIDAASAVDRVLGTVTTKIEEVMKKVNSAAKSVQESQLGQSLKTKYEALKALKQRIGEVVDAGKELYDEGKSLYNEGEQLYGQGKQLYGDTVSLYEQGQGVYEEAMDSLALQQSESTSTLNLQLEELQTQMNNRKKVITEELEARVNMAKENDQALQQLYASAEDDVKDAIAAKIEENENQRRAYEAALASMKDGKNEFLDADEEYQKLKSQYNETNDKLNSTKENLKRKGTSLATSFIKNMLTKTKEQKQSEYRALEGANYIGEDTEFNQAAVDEVDAVRNENLKSDLVSTMFEVIQMRKEHTKTADKIDMIADNAVNVDYAVTAERLQNEQVIQKLKLLHDKVNMEIQDLRVQTSNVMKNQGYKILNPSKDPSEINMDSYELTADDLKKRGLGQ